MTSAPKVIPIRSPFRVLASVVLFLAATLAGAAAPPPPVTSAPSTAEQIAARRAELAADLERVRNQIASAGERPPQPLLLEAEVLARIQLILEQESAAYDQGRESNDALEEAKRALADIRTSGLTEPAPYSVLLLDAVRDELNAMRTRVKTIESTVTAADQARQSARKARDERAAARRRAREARDANTNESAAPALAQQLRAAELDSRVADAELLLRQVEHDREALRRDVARVRLETLEERERRIAASTVFRTDDLRNQIVELEAREESLRKRLDAQQRLLGFAETAWFDAKRRSDSGTGDAEVQSEEVAARRLAFQLRQREVAMLTKRIERVVRMRDIWSRRFQADRAATDRATLAQWDAEAKTFLESLDTEGRVQELERRDVRQGLAAIQGRLDAEPAVRPEVAKPLREQVRLIAEFDRIFEENTTSIDGARRFTDRLRADIGAKISTTTMSERLGALRASVQKLWETELTTVDDRPITIGKIVIGIVLLLVGFLLARLFTSWLGRRMLPRLGLNEGAAAAIRSIVFYVLLVCLGFIALRTINVPLTAFTILGGAFAIGIGFGSQNIMNNFMSGLILLAERPIRVGDLIQLGELHGVVQHIGARSTRVLTGSNIEIVVPNSSFLENNVINLTLSETKLRIHVAVGVAYGSPTRDVARLLRKAVEEHGRVLKTPSPVILFSDFGDNALHFEIHFWIKMKTMMERRTIESDVRFRVDSLFHDAGVVIAFPQRDVHFDASRPIDIRMVTADASLNPEA